MNELSRARAEIDRAEEMIRQARTGVLDINPISLTEWENQMRARIKAATTILEKYGSTYALPDEQEIRQPARHRHPMKMSRQRRWQLKHKKLGLCILCQSPLATSAYCLKHAIANRERTRKLKPRKMRYNSLTYRLTKQPA